MLRWSVSRFARQISGTVTAPITRGMKPYSGVAFALPAAGYPGRYAHRALTSSEKHRIVERVIRRVNERFRWLT